MQKTIPPAKKFLFPALLSVGMLISLQADDSFTTAGGVRVRSERMSIEADRVFRKIRRIDNFLVRCFKLDVRQRAGFLVVEIVPEARSINVLRDDSGGVLIQVPESPEIFERDFQFQRKFYYALTLPRLQRPARSEVGFPVWLTCGIAGTLHERDENDPRMIKRQRRNRGLRMLLEIGRPTQLTNLLELTARPDSPTGRAVLEDLSRFLLDTAQKGSTERDNALAEYALRLSEGMPLSRAAEGGLMRIFAQKAEVSAAFFGDDLSELTRRGKANYYLFRQAWSEAFQFSAPLEAHFARILLRRIVTIPGPDGKVVPIVRLNDLYKDKELEWENLRLSRVRMCSALRGMLPLSLRKESSDLEQAVASLRRNEGGLERIAEQFRNLEFALRRQERLERLAFEIERKTYPFPLLYPYSLAEPGDNPTPSPSWKAFLDKAERDFF
ncbi:MAG: hypothetical protein PHS41_10600 [Victivallaceae bacterium]|nr:hypothetical protein [Victivallaceae bacterium]